MIDRACPITRLSPGDGGHYFFGYYDRCPWSPDGKSVLAHRAAFCDRVPGPADEAEVGLIDPGSRRFEALARTRAWNWQQGSGLHWLDDGSIVFNVRRRSASGELGATVLGPDGSPRRELDVPLSVTHGNVGLTLSFARLTRCRPEYGYAGLTDPHAGEDAPKGDGVWRVDLTTGEASMLVSIAQLAAHRPGQVRPAGPHHVNHLMFNPSGTRFCFMHRFQREGGIQHSRLFTLGADGSGLRLLFEGFVSHYGWRDDSTLLAWAGRRALLGAGGAAGGGGGGGGGAAAVMALAKRSLRPIYRALGKPRWLMHRVMKDSYMLFRDAEGAQPEEFAKGELTTDGHCTWSRDGRWVLTDGYPDGGFQPLLVFDSASGRCVRVGRYRSPRRFDGPIRVDLHPRFSRDGRWVCIDSAMDDRRAMYAVDVSAVLGPAAAAGPVAEGAR